MTTSEPSQATLFAAGCETADTLWATPRAQMGSLHQPSADRPHIGGGKPKRLEVEVGRGKELTSSPAATPASRSLSPGSDWARRMTAISGRRCAASLPTSGPVASWLRTLLGTSRWASTRCWLTWKTSATPAGRSLFRLVPSMPSTAEIASGFWPTPKAGHEYRQHTAGQAEKDGRHGWKLPGAVADSLSPEPVRLWPTPDVPNGGRGIPKDAERRGNSIYTASGRKVQEGLANAVKQTTRDGLWTTPCADDTGHRSSRYAQGGTALSAQAGGKLHGRWTLALMSFPPDWCDDLPPDPLSSDGTPR